MEEGSKSKKSIFVGGIGDDVDESVIYENFTTFGEHIQILEPHMLMQIHRCTGDILEVQLPPATMNPNQQTG